MNRKIVILSAVFIIIFIGFYYGYKLNEKVILKNNKNVQKVSYKKITAKDAEQKILKDKDIIVLDVRTQKEYKQKHIPNSVLIPLNLLNRKVEKKITNRDKTIIVYCRSGNRSRAASNILIKKGYKNVYDLGGIDKWPYKIIYK